MLSLESPSYVEWQPRGELRRYVRCTWVGGPGSPGAEPVLPDGCMDLVWDGTRLLVAGPDTGPKPDDHAGSFVVGLRLRPGTGSVVLGVPAFEMRDRRVDIGDLWQDAPRLLDELSQSASLSRARAILEDVVATRVDSQRSPDPVVERAVRALEADPSRNATVLVASTAGLSERQLHRRFLASVGYGPKYLHRVLRFQAFLRLSASPRLGLGDIAYRCGYADQSHLTRETSSLAGRTPGQLRAARAPGVRNVQDFA